MPSYPLPSLQAEPEPGPARDLKNALEEQAEVWLSDYISKLAERQTSLDEKVVNDIVWGSVRVYPWEVAVLDSPLMQRLRGIRQLGVIHWVYPNAGHSRLEHSIGVMHAVQKILDGIERNSGVLGRSVVDADTAYLMRLAGLIHDCGHVLMSHVTESVIGDLPGADDLRYWLTEEYSPRSKPSISETYAAIFVRSPSFKELLSLPVAGADFLRDAGDACIKIAGLLLGSPVFSDKAFLSLVINGPFDADKLDYIQRDSRMAGVPCALDVSRLVEKIHVVSIPPGKRPDWDKHREWACVGDDEPLQVLAIPRSATSVLDELAIGRATLFQKVYFHQKVRAIELQVRQATSAMDLSATRWLRMSDESVIQQDSASAERLRHRDFLKRALHFNAPDDEEEDAPWWRRVSQTCRDQRRHDLNKRILVESSKAAEILDLPAGVLRERPPAIDIPPVKDLDLEAFLGTTYRDLGPAPAAVAGQRTEIGKLLAKLHGCVYGPSECLMAVFFGAAKVLARDYGFEATQACFSKTKLEPAELKQGLAKLLAAGFFEDAPPRVLERDLTEEVQSHGAKLVERFLRVATPRIVRLAENLGRYQSPDGNPVSASSIAAYLRQFGPVERVRVALRLLENLDFKDRAFFVDALSSCVAQLGERNGTYICPLGSSGDSSAMLSYLMGDLAPENRREVTALEVALDRENVQQIVLWDDFCGRGGHTITALAQWLGRQSTVPEKLLLKERLAYPLSDDRKATLLRTRVSLAFAISTPAGLNNLSQALKLLDMGETEVLEPHWTLSDEDTLKDDRLVFTSTEEQEEFYSFLNERAAEVHKPKTMRQDDPWDDEKVSQRLRGYGNTAARVVFFYNVPTMTLTGLWDGAPGIWKPLLPRRTKPRLGSKPSNQR